jgi:hypothetical protein
MKRLTSVSFFVGLFISFPIVCLAQTTFTIEADKKIYAVGDTVKMSIYARNTLTKDDTLRFPSSCQVNFFVDGYDYSTGAGCFDYLTSQVIPARDSVSWLRPYPRRGGTPQPILGVGVHWIVGEVLGYSSTDTLRISVTSVTGIEGISVLPNEVELSQNYPNPFNPSTTISFELAKKSIVVLNILNLLGQEVATLINEEKEAGPHSVQWNAASLPSGIYFYTLHAGEFAQTKKLVLIK